MLSGIRVFSSDPVWKQIVSGLGATLVENAIFADVNIDLLKFDLPVSPIKLKSVIIAAADNTKILESVFGRSVSLSPIQKKIIVKLYQSGGMKADDLKIALGYAEDTTTHTVDTAIYGLRKIYGHDFIKNDNGVYKIDRV
ncbi:MAG: helix-turn-helix domain-containing protein [Alphaproteobacteria bacterium]|nr:helix-turn-helix domain-containing protein [Alphaproteobacteria bacterium]